MFTWQGVPTSTDLVLQAVETTGLLSGVNDVKLYLYNYTTSGWVAITADTEDWYYIHPPTYHYHEYNLLQAVFSSDDYNNSGEVQIKIQNTSTQWYATGDTVQVDLFVLDVRMPSASISKSVSPSVSPSASISKSISPSVSPSASISKSISPSFGVSSSISKSVSSSVSPSSSASPSISPSIDFGTYVTDINGVTLFDSMNNISLDIISSINGITIT